MEREKFVRILKDYFTFTRSERSGMFILCFLLLVSIIVRIGAGYVQPGEPADQTAFLKLMEKIQSEADRKTEPEKKMFAFDPNTISDSELDSLQIPAKIALNLRRYREKGGVFRKPDDLRKLYGMNDSVFRVILPFIRLADFHPPMLKEERKPGHSGSREYIPVRKTPERTGATTPGREENLLELNAADSLELLELPGIGPAFAGRIVRYRKILGGFCSLDQLSEVYGMTPERKDQLVRWVKVDRSLVIPIRINFADYYQLSRHPYVSGSEAKRIIDWRSANGPFSDIVQLLKASILDSVQVRKLEPYLSCQ